MSFQILNAQDKKPAKGILRLIVLGAASESAQGPPTLVNLQCWRLYAQPAIPEHPNPTKIREFAACFNEFDIERVERPLAYFKPARPD